MQIKCVFEVGDTVRDMHTRFDSVFDAVPILVSWGGLLPQFLHLRWHIGMHKPQTRSTRRLRSAASVTCTVPRTRTRLGDRSFAVTGPRVWNSLPAALRAVEDYEQFNAQLKTHLFD